jgi:hypothetical protein
MAGQTSSGSTVHNSLISVAGKPADHLIDRPEAVVEHQPPGGSGDDGRDHDWQQQDGDEHLAQRHAVDEQHRQKEAEDKLDRQGHGGEHDGAQNGAPQAGILKQALVVDEPVKAAVVGEHVDVLEAGHQQLHEGIEPD